MDVGEKKNVGVALDGSVCSALVLCGLGVDGKVKGEGAVHDTSGNFPFLIHAGELAGLNGSGHFGVDHFNRREGGNFGIFNAAGLCDFQRVIDDMYLVLQRGIRNESHIGEEKQTVDSLHLKYTHVRERLACAQSHFLVQNAL